ncbi:hypothetical protein K470DRAFT_231817 [Piedraia hortae CBS 480.64]|uniref:Fork-head domain-containing protein n=1 Tax=Piedraia hortae CBS 480.64 TaxID=1314780 RepID=A0A6A7C0N7_9PEZI|nr:hypothetical protein K470DRAFT_231817 [Piedraia hortae CBS 480.64]
MPPTGRKTTRTRRQSSNSRPVTPESTATPQRRPRKRQRPNEPTQRSTRRKRKASQDLERPGPDDVSDAETETAMPSETEILQRLHVSDVPVNATTDFANGLLEGKDHVPGYGKIAGRGWTFIIRELQVTIGRLQALVESAGTESPGGQTTMTSINIDLGPDKQVSREHATICYSAEARKWFIIVKGRNGVRVDNHFLKRGAKMYLRNGSVFEIAKTQMAFIIMDSEGPVWDDAVIRQTLKSSSSADEDDEEPQNPPQETPSRAHQQQGHTFIRTSPSGNHRGSLMDSAESIDYSADSARDLKPPHSYAQLIGMAILSTPDQQMALSNIYRWIKANYAFYRHNTSAWQNSIRHNLSLNKAFTKIARRTDEPGKGMKWMIEPSEFDTFVQQGMKGCRRPTTAVVGSSPIRSPIRSGYSDQTPSKPTFSLSSESFTPGRGPTVTVTSARRQTVPSTSVGLGISSDRDFLRGTPSKALYSPPAVQDYHGGPLGTPFPMRPSQRLPPPSTLKRPSDFIQFSSPAPFWKMDGLAGTMFDSSPVKSRMQVERSSSPPAPHSGNLDGSPLGRKHAPSSSVPLQSPVGQGSQAASAQTPAPDAAQSTVQPSAPQPQPQPQSQPQSQSQSQIHPHSTISPTGPKDDHIPAISIPRLITPPPSKRHAPTDDDDDDEEEGIDLAKGFPSISAFHQRGEIMSRH